MPFFAWSSACLARHRLLWMEERNSWNEGICSDLRNILRSLCQNMSPFNAFHAFMSISVYGLICWLQSFLGQFLLSDQHVCFELVEQFDNSIGFHSSPRSLIDQLPWDLLAFFQPTISILSSNTRLVFFVKEKTWHSGETSTSIWKLQPIMVRRKRLLIDLWVYCHRTSFVSLC